MVRPEGGPKYSGLTEPKWSVSFNFLAKFWNFGLNGKRPQFFSSSILQLPRPHQLVCSQANYNTLKFKICFQWQRSQSRNPGKGKPNDLLQTAL